MTLSLGTVRALFLYVPLVACALFVLFGKPPPRRAAGALLALLWAMPALLVVEALADHFEWWRMSAPTGLFPIAGDVWLGWAIAWGPLPVLALWRRPIVVLLVAWWVDVTMMPFALSLVTLGHEWLIGELTALTFVMLPGMLLARWTIQQRFLNARVVMQMAIFGAWTLWIMPMAALRFRPPNGSPMWLALPVLAPFALVAASAVQEFARRGEGTPLPYDPPQRLVTSGPYAYVRNPMQASMTIVLLGLGAILKSPYLALCALAAASYGSGFAAWHEKVTMPERFGEGWDAYRNAVRSWLPRLRPYVATPSTIYVAFTCDMCTGVGAWIARRGPVGLKIAAAETLPNPPRRVMYVPSDGGAAEHGVAAFARALEHVNIVWALLGFAIRLPIVRVFVQVIVDACGGGPRTITSCDASQLPAQSAARLTASTT